MMARALVVVLAGCGGNSTTHNDGIDGGGGNGSCTISLLHAGVMIGSYCEDFTGSYYAGSQGMVSCNNLSGTYSTSACSRTGSLGSCTEGNGNLADTQTFFSLPDGSGYTSSEAEALCSNENGSWTPPG